jgi:hypothetical protein
MVTAVGIAMTVNGSCQTRWAFLIWRTVATTLRFQVIAYELGRLSFINVGKLTDRAVAGQYS